jgi:hypothetical protein
VDELDLIDPEPGVTRVLTAEGWEGTNYIDPGDERAALS